MKNVHHLVRRHSLAVFILCAISSAYAMERGTTASGITYVSGGVGQTEMDELNFEKKSFNLSLTTAAKGSGSYLSSIHIRILDAHTRAPLLEHTMDGPLLLVTLPVGRYDIQASHDAVNGSPSQMLTKSATVHSTGQHQMVFYFDSNDQVGLKK